MDQKTEKKESDVNHLEVDDAITVRGDSTEEFNGELPAARGETAASIQPPGPCSSATTASSEACLIDKDKEGQRHEPQGSDEEQAQVSDEPKQQRNEIRQTDEEPQKDEQEDVQEVTKEPSLSMQITENPNEAVQRRDIGKAAGLAASSEATKYLKKKILKTKETDKEPRENEKIQRTTIDRRTLFHRASTERKKQHGERRGVVEEEIVQQQPSSFASSSFKLNLAAGLLLLAMIYILLVLLNLCGTLTRTN